ncbi:metal ABC transporter solute-binding protein, Zn/Mn family [Owenweeksia hongkongensis]|uniref:metal ABC transporter solute-binding protein, Zn/Mn family n=1 Tax=Owenweeksia hongkongensis TaxID=253245 RepID=UPI003A8F7A92
MKKIILFCVLAVFAISCTETKKDDRPHIVCTTSIIGDAVQNLVGDTIKVTSLMGAGVDPHLYKATQGDIAALTNADVVVYNGLHLEGKMGEIFEKLGKTKPTFAIADFVPKNLLINSTDFQGAEDPHIWFDVTVWVRGVNGLSKKLQETFPAYADSIEANRQDYAKELYYLHGRIVDQLNQISADQRIMITAHDAFKYFGKQYGMEVRGLQGISTTAEYGLQDVSELVKYITEKKIKAIFVESSVPKKSIEAVIEGCRESGHDVKLGGELYSDALGAAGTPEGTYVGMFDHNVKVITEALK